MIDCKRASQLISQSLDRRLTLSERFCLRFHTWTCDPCKRFSQQLLALRQVFKRMSDNIANDKHIQLSPESKSRIAKVIDSIDQR